MLLDIDCEREMAGQSKLSVRLVLGSSRQLSDAGKTYGYKIRKEF